MGKYWKKRNRKKRSETANNRDDKRNKSNKWEDTGKKHWKFYFFSTLSSFRGGEVSRGFSCVIWVIINNFCQIIAHSHLMEGPLCMTDCQKGMVGYGKKKECCTYPIAFGACWFCSWELDFQDSRSKSSDWPPFFVAEFLYVINQPLHARIESFY